jgi:hypothetical protein
MTRLLWLSVGICAWGAPAASLAAQPCPADSEVSPAELSAQAHDVHIYPTFCSIPPTPTGVRNAAAFKSAVVDTRVAGVRLVDQTAPSTFSLEDTDRFAAEARAEAAPPPPMTTPEEPGSQDFVDTGRKLVTPPSRPH